MPFRYFAYGSNLWMPRMRERCPSARVVGPSLLHGWTAVCDKPSTDGSAKLNIRPDADGAVAGVVYQIDDAERPRLDAAEPRYRAIETPAGLAYAYDGPPTLARPHDWYVDLVVAGARSHGLEPPSGIGRRRG